MVIEIRTNTPKPNHIKDNVEKQMREAYKIKPPSAGLVDYIKKAEADHSHVLAIVEKHRERLAYNAAYQRDLRTIKRLGLDMTVKEFRLTNEGAALATRGYRKSKET